MFHGALPLGINRKTDILGTNSYVFFVYKRRIQKNIYSEIFQWVHVFGFLGGIRSEMACVGELQEWLWHCMGYLSKVDH